MNRKHSRTLAAITAVMMAATGAVADTVAGAAPGEVSSGGLHLIASVDSNNVVPAGGDIAPGIPFVHAVKVSGDFSVALDGVSAVRSGEIVAGYLIGCAVDIANGIAIGIAPSFGVNASISPSFGVEGAINLAIDAPPSISIGVGAAVQPSVGVEAAITGELAVNLAPGSVAAAVIGEAELDRDATFPYTFAHTNTPLNISGCLSPASAMPFVTVHADSTNSTVQTTGYGASFWF